MGAFVKVDHANKPALSAFLTAHAPVMMFPLVNLARHGLDGDHPRAISAWAVWEGDQMQDVIALSREGVVFPYVPGRDFAGAATVLRGRQIKGFLGAGAQVQALRAATGLTHRARLDVVEPAFRLDIAALQVPDVTGLRLCPLNAAPYEQLVAWRADYEVEALNTPPEMARAQAERQIRSFITTDSHRVLMADDKPVAMTGFNAVSTDIVQVGGVYTPPALRGQGYARAALALHLRAAAKTGVRRAVLSAASETAARTYRAIGFVESGDFALVMYDSPQVAHG